MFLNLLPVVGFILFGCARFVARIRRNSSMWCFRSASSAFNNQLRAEFEKAEAIASGSRSKSPAAAALLAADGADGAGCLPAATAVFTPPSAPTRWDIHSWNWTLAYFLFLYPIVISSLIRHFDCTVSEPFEFYTIWKLSADPSVVCYVSGPVGQVFYHLPAIRALNSIDNTHWLELTYIWVPIFTLITAIGVPLFFVVAVRSALAREHRKLQPYAGSVSAGPSIAASTPSSVVRAMLLNRSGVRQTIGLLVGAYAPKYYWFELVRSVFVSTPRHFSRLL